MKELTLQQQQQGLERYFQQCITHPDYDKKLESLNDEQQRINLDREDHTNADYKYHITAKQTLELARRAGELFERANDAEKNELLKLVLSNVTLNEKKLVFLIRKPFDTIANVKGYPVLLAWRDSFRKFDWAYFYSDVDFHTKSINQLITLAR